MNRGILSNKVEDGLCPPPPATVEIRRPIVGLRRCAYENNAEGRGELVMALGDPFWKYARSMSLGMILECDYMVLSDFCVFLAIISLTF